MNPFATHAQRWRLGAVCYLNTKPLTFGLNDDPKALVEYDVPSRLADRLQEGTVDAALIPAIDLLHRAPDWRIVSNACIACDGVTLTVRIFSRIDPADVTTLHVDRDSHSSVALADVIWRETFGRSLNIVPIDATRADRTRIDDYQAVLLIGDKVINPPPGVESFPIQTDLGAAWKSLTGLPFVFAVWAARNTADTHPLADILEHARDLGLQNVADIARCAAPEMGWPAGLAKRYLTEYLDFTMTDRHRRGLDEFKRLAIKHDLIREHAEIEISP